MKVIKGVSVKAGEVVAGVGRPALVEPEVPVLGDWWWHSCVPKLPEETTMAEFRSMMEAKGLLVLRQDMGDDPDVKWDSDLDLKDWTPTAPSGFFMLVLGDDEDGPFVIWGKNKDEDRYCAHCHDIFHPLLRKESPELCWDCVTGVNLYQGAA